MPTCDTTSYLLPVNDAILWFRAVKRGKGNILLTFCLIMGKSYKLYILIALQHRQVCNDVDVLSPLQDITSFISLRHHFTFQCAFQIYALNHPETCSFSGHDKLTNSSKVLTMHADQLLPACFF